MHGMRILAGTVLLVACITGKMEGQDSASTLQRQVDSLRAANILKQQEALAAANRSFTFGLSVGWRHIVGGKRTVNRDAVITPNDHVVRIDEIDNGSVVVSGVVLATPFKKYKDATAQRLDRANSLWRLGFLANVDLASFSADKVSTFNQSVEGGGGVVVRLSDDFGIGLTLERVFSRRARDWVRALEGQPITVDGKNLETLDKGDDRYFKSDNMTALSLKFVYVFGH